MRKLRKNQSIIWDISIEDFKKLVENSSSIGEILKFFKLTNKGGNSNTVKRRIKHENIDMAHIKLGKGSNKGRKFKNLILNFFVKTQQQIGIILNKE